MQFAKISDNSSAILAASSIATSLLVVDDDPIQRRVIAKIGAQAGHRALTASSLAEATEILASQRIDCLTIDLGLGADSGLDLFQLIVAQGRKIEVLIISGAGEDLLELTRSFAQKKGVELFDVFPKPLDLARLRASLARTRETCWLEHQAEG